MAEKQSPENPSSHEFHPAKSGPGVVTRLERVGRWIVVVAAVVLGLWLVYALSAAFVPRWWAQRVGARVDGRFSAGIGWGFGYGFFATTLSLLVLAQVRRQFLAWWGRLIVVVVALLISVPNLLTLLVTIGNGKAAHAGRRIFDVNAPGFQWATLIGVIAAVIVVVVSFLVMWRLRSRKHQVSDLREQIADQEKGAHGDTSPGKSGKN